MGFPGWGRAWGQTSSRPTGTQLSRWYVVAMSLAGGSSYPDVIVVLQAVLYVVQELADVQLAQTALEQRVHALEGCLPHVQTIIHCVFKGPHLHLQEGRIKD